MNTNRRQTFLWAGMLLLAALAISLGVMQAPVAAAACTTTLNAGDDIQAAVTAATAGDVICLSPGSYTPAATVIIDKALTLQGPQAAVDPRPSEGSSRTPGSAAEAVIDGGGTLGTIIRIASSDVVLDGFEVKSGTGDLIASLAGSDIANVRVSYLIVHNATVDEGMQIRDCANCVIEYNHAFDTQGEGINLCCGSAGGLIQFNETTDIDSENAAIYIYESVNTTIQCNLIDGTSQNEGIKIGAKAGTDAALSGGRILYNEILDTAQDGIAVYMSDVEVTGNSVSGSTSENGAIYVAQNVGNIQITYNSLISNTLNTAKWGNPGAVMIGSSGGQSATGILVENNNIVTNTPNGATNIATGTLDAENNWWGAADGPGPVGPGSGDAVSTNVDFDPWLTQPVEIPDGPCGSEVGVFMSTTVPGVTDDALAFGAEDIIKWDGAAWSTWFDGSAAGLAPVGKWKHNLNAIYIPDPGQPDVIVSFTQNARFVPGIIPKVDGMDLVMWDGTDWTLYFDGSDVDLTNKTQEKIDALHVRPGSESPVGAGCVAYLLISTQGPGRVTNGPYPGFRFAGEDVLGFCATNLGADTTGVWHILVDGSAQGMPYNSTDSISMSADGNTLYLTTKKAFAVDAAFGDHSMVFTYDMTTEEFAGPVFVAADYGLHERVDALDIR